MREENNTEKLGEPEDVCAFSPHPLLSDNGTIGRGGDYCFSFPFLSYIMISILIHGTCYLELLIHVTSYFPKPCKPLTKHVNYFNRPRDSAAAVQIDFSRALRAL